MIRTIIVCLLLVLPLLAGPAEAIVVACPNGFQNCDPYSGTCYTAWTASLAGQVQANCSANPAACWQQSLTSAACSAPIPPPVNPNAIRVCPFGVDCGAGHPPHPIDQYPSFDVRAFSGPALDGVIYYYQGHPPINGPLLPPSKDVQEVYDCMLYHFNTSPIGDGLSCGNPSSYYDNWSGRLVRSPTFVFEPPPPSSCTWVIAPTSPVQPCILPQAALLAAMKNDSPTQWTGLSNYYRKLNRRIDKLGWSLTNGLRGAPGSKRYTAYVARQVWLIDLAALIVQLVADPPNPNYQSFPGPGVFPPLTPLTPDATLTQTQINAIQAWLATLREAVITGRQMTDTMDNLGGAILAAEAGTPGAATWVRNLAVHADTTLATLATQGLAEIAARAAMVAVEPNVSIPAGACATPTAAANVLKQAVQGGSSLYQGHLLYQEQLVTCGDAISDPAWLASESAEDATLWNSFATFSIASYLCGANPAYCGGGPGITVTPSTLAFGSIIVGNKSGNQNATVKNTGTSNLVIGTVTRSGPDVGMFLKAVPNDLCSGHTLTPNQTCTVGIKFAPLSLGAKSATLVIPSTLPTVTLPLTGTGILATGADINVTPLSLAYGGVVVGGSSALIGVTVQNVGNVNLILGTVTRSGADVGLFVKAAQNDLCSGVTLAPMATCTVGLKFKPTSTGAKSATLNIPSNDGDEPSVAIPMTGTGL